MGYRIILAIMLLAASAFGADKYLMLGIDTDATTHDKLALLAVINKYLDVDYTGDMAITIYKVSNPSQKAIIGCWDVAGRKFPFTRQQAENYFVNHSGDFDNVNHIRLIGSDDPMGTLTELGWAH